MEVRVRVPAPLRDLVAGAHTVTVDPGGVAIARAGAGVTVGAVLDVLAVDHPALERRVRDEQGHTRVHVNLFVGADNIRDRDGLSTPVSDGEELTIIAAVSGG